MKKIFKRYRQFFGLFCGILFLSTAFGQNITNDDYTIKARQHYQIGNALYEQGKYAEAQVEFKEALDLLGQRNVTLTQKHDETEIAQAKEPQVQDKEKATSIVARNVREYLITEEDEFHISVWQNPDLDQDVIVRPDGRISFPLVGDLEASGLTITQLDENLTQRLKEFIKSPEVSISLKKMGGKKVVVLGEVVNPGVYSVSGVHTALQAIGLAGGFTKDSVPSSTVLIRGGFAKPQAKRFNLSLALKGDLAQNPLLQSEDIIFVPKKFIANVNYFLSQVLDPLSRAAYTAQSLQSF